MRVQCFPRCCGAGVLIIEHLTGKGKEADMEFIKSWVAYAKRNGYNMYDYPHQYGGKQGDPMSCVTVIGGKGDQQGTSWGMLLAITTPGLKEAAERLKEFGFKELLTTFNPVMHHNIILWGIDLNKVTAAMVKPIETKEKETVKSK